MNSHIIAVVLLLAGVATILYHIRAIGDARDNQDALDEANVNGNRDIMLIDAEQVVRSEVDRLKGQVVLSLLLLLALFREPLYLDFPPSSSSQWRTIFWAIIIAGYQFSLLRSVRRDARDRSRKMMLARQKRRYAIEVAEGLADGSH